MLESVNMVCPGCVWISCACYNEGKKKGGIERNGSVVRMESSRTPGVVLLSLYSERRKSYRKESGFYGLVCPVFSRESPVKLNG